MPPGYLSPFLHSQGGRQILVASWLNVGQPGVCVDTLAEYIRNIILFLALCLVSGCSTNRDQSRSDRSFTLRATDVEIVFNGTITVEAYDHLAKLLDSLEKVPGRLSITSSGGDASAGIDFGLLIHKFGLDVYVPAYCISSCANYVFTAGRKKLLEQHSFLMWHGGATQQGIAEPPECEKDGWYDELFDCDPEQFSNEFDPIVAKWLEKERHFFETVNVDQRITILGQLEEIRCGEGHTDGWYYSVADLINLGVHEIEVLGGEWSPTPPSNEIVFCRVDLSRLPNKALHWPPGYPSSFLHSQDRRRTLVSS